MARIEIERTGRRGIWVDGFLPEKKKLTQARRKLELAGETLEKCSELQGIHEPEQLFQGLVTGSREKYHRLAEERGEAQLHFCEVFFLNFDPQTLYYPYTPFVREIPAGRRRSYRQIIFTFSHDECACGEGCVDQTLRNTGFRIRPKTDYREYEAFRGFCELILNEVVRPYVAPCLAACRKLQDYGFRSQCRGF